MRPIFEAEVAQIDILSSCHLACANCTRFVGHHAKNYSLSIECFREAVASLEGFEGQIGIMGGEPALHPKFLEILEAYRELVPIERRSLWTSGFKWTEYADTINATFLPDRIHYNDHTQRDGKHQPLGVAVQEVVEDEALMWELINACSFQEHWSPVINESGAYFCEIAGTQDRVLHGGKHAWPVEPGWWQKRPEDFQDQVKALCVNCSGCLPMPAFSDGRGGRDGPTVDVVSPGVHKMLLDAGSPKARRGQIEIWDKKITREDLDEIKDWNPRSFRGFVAHNPQDVAAAALNREMDDIVIAELDKVAE